MAPRSAARSASQMRIRRRRRALLGAVVVVAVALLAVWALRPSDPPVVTDYVSDSAVDEAAANAAKSAGEAAKAADEIEQRTWSIGPYAADVPVADGVSAGATAGNRVALTFDDGPGPATGAILDLLRKYRMRGTFFVLGNRAAEDPTMLKRIVDEGHVIGNHSWSHASLVTLSAQGVRDELDRATQAITGATGHTVTVQRPPFGDFDAKVNRLVRQKGMLPILWNVDSNDWALDDAQQIANNVTGAAAFGPGAIILFHDSGERTDATVNAVRIVLDALKAQRLTSVTVPELLRQGPPDTVSPGTYAPSTYAERG